MNIKCHKYQRKVIELMFAMLMLTIIARAQTSRIRLIGAGIYTKQSNIKNYQLRDHLGSVRTAISLDKRSLTASIQNYYPYGFKLVNSEQSLVSEHGFQGKGFDSEVKGPFNSCDFHARIYDPRAARWLSADPLEYQFPEYATYQAMNNNPIYFIDMDGRSAQGFLRRLGKNIFRKMDDDIATRVGDMVNGIKPGEIRSKKKALKKQGEVKIGNQRVLPKKTGFSQSFWNDAAYLQSLKAQINTNLLDPLKKEKALIKGYKDKYNRLRQQVKAKIKTYNPDADIHLRREQIQDMVVDFMKKNTDAPLDRMFKDKIVNFNDEQRRMFNSMRSYLLEGNSTAWRQLHQLVPDLFDDIDPVKIVKWYERRIARANELAKANKTDIEKYENLIQELEDAFLYGQRGRYTVKP